MRQEDLETFVAVAEYGTISTAAEHLFITQSAASDRIRSLEADIGTQLIVRQRGVRSASLTPAGERLVPIANGILSLLDEAARVDNGPRQQRLVVAANDSLNAILLIPFYRAFIENHPDITLDLQTRNSRAINRAVEDRTADVGLAFSLMRYPNLTSHALFRDPWVVLCDRASAFAKTGDITGLIGEREVYSPFSSEYHTWHRHYFASFSHPKISVGNAAQLEAFMDDAADWCIAPQSVARPSAERNPRLVARPLPEQPPARICHFITHRALPEDKLALADLFETELRDFVATLGLARP